MKIIDSYQIHSLIRQINESLDPELEKRLRMDLKKYCEMSGKDYLKVCELAGLETKGLEAMSSEIIKAIEAKTSGTWEYDETTGRVNIDGSFSMNLRWSSGRSDMDLIKKVKFGKITGDFSLIGSGGDVTDSEWESICPDSVGGGLNISANKFKELVIPGFIGKWLDISGNNLTSLDGCPEEVNGYFSCNDNKLSNLIGGPVKVTGDYDCSDQRGEGSFKLEGCAKEIGESFKCVNNYIETLDGGPEKVGAGLDLENNKLIDLKGSLKEVGTSGRYYSIDVKRNNIATLEGLPLSVSPSNIECSKNLIPPAVLKEVFRDAQRMKSWIAAYLELSATERFKRMGKAQRDPIRDRITPEIIKKNPAALGPVWKNTNLMSDPVVSRLIKKSGVKQDDSFMDDVELTSDLDDLGF